LNYFENSKRIVIKIGSSLLVNPRNGRVKKDWLDSLAEDIFSLRQQNKDVLIVTSGAVAIGKKFLGFPKQKKLKLEEKQACASAGQLNLIHDYQEAFSYFNMKISQILITLNDTENKRNYLNSKSTIDTLLKLGVIPIINENDTITTQEIRFGDNDRLAARVAGMCSADILVLLSDIDGLYSSNPNIDKDAKFIPIIKEITKDIKNMAGETTTSYGTGGMTTKILAGEIALSAGCKMVIAQGKKENPIKNIINGGKSSWFLPACSPEEAHKSWLSGSLKPCGEIYVDTGAQKAIEKNKSLLPIGVKKTKGEFLRGDTVLIKSEKGETIAKGISSYSSQDIEKIKQNHSKNIEKILGYSGRLEVIHIDNMVLI
jgi:glutamate 5-kinase